MEGGNGKKAYICDDQARGSGGAGEFDNLRKKQLLIGIEVEEGGDNNYGVFVSLAPFLLIIPNHTHYYSFFEQRPARESRLYILLLQCV